jgi:hypothetical protein
MLPDRYAHYIDVAEELLFTVPMELRIYSDCTFKACGFDFPYLFS